jgi:hypothetical protein
MIVAAEELVRTCRRYSLQEIGYGCEMTIARAPVIEYARA